MVKKDLQTKNKETFETQIIEFIAGIMKGLGLDDLSALLIANIYIEPSEVSMDSLAKKTGYSIASLSTKLRMLETLQIVQRIRKPGTKKAYYYIEKDLYCLMKMKFQVIYEHEIMPAKTQLPEILKKFKSSKLSKEDKIKFDIMTNYHNQMLEIEKLISSFQSELDKLSKNRCTS